MIKHRSDVDVLRVSEDGISAISTETPLQEKERAILVERGFSEKAISALSKQMLKLTSHYVTDFCEQINKLCDEITSPTKLKKIKPYANFALNLLGENKHFKEDSLPGSMNQFDYVKYYMNGLITNSDQVKMNMVAKVTANSISRLISIRDVAEAALPADIDYRSRLLDALNQTLSSMKSALLNVINSIIENTPSSSERGDWLGAPSSVQDFLNKHNLKDQREKI